MSKKAGYIEYLRSRRPGSPNPTQGRQVGRTSLYANDLMWSLCLTAVIDAAIDGDTEKLAKVCQWLKGGPECP